MGALRLIRALGLLLLIVSSTSVRVQAQIYAAEFGNPTDRYDHGILGDAIEWASLTIKDDSGKTAVFNLPENMVFEDLTPRVVDATGDSKMEVVVVESHLDLGARLAIYTMRGRLAATPHLGQSHRWLAPVGAEDLDGDGQVEIAFVEKPHLTKILRLYRLKGKKLKLIASMRGLTNHRIGEDFISGGIRNCGQGHEIITANNNWSRIQATRFSDGVLSSRSLGKFSGQSGMKAALSCKF